MGKNTNKVPSISIIVPVYNVEKYLKKCIDSILNQSFQNFELILVDDGSPDGCPAICDEYAKLYAKISVIHKKMEDYLMLEILQLLNQRENILYL